MHPQLERQMSQFLCEKVMLYPFLRTFRADFNHVIAEMIARPKLEGSQSSDTLGQALPSVSAVTKGILTAEIGGRAWARVP